MTNLDMLLLITIISVGVLDLLAILFFIGTGLLYLMKEEQPKEDVQNNPSLWC